MGRTAKTSIVMSLVSGRGNPIFNSVSLHKHELDTPREDYNVLSYSDVNYDFERRKRCVEAKKAVAAVKPERKPKREITKNMRLSLDVPHNPALKLPDDEIPEVYTKPVGERQVVNITTMLINEQIGNVLERFNACSCDKCLTRITMRVLAEIKPQFVHVATSGDADAVNEQLALNRNEVISELTKIVIRTKANPLHNEK